MSNVFSGSEVLELGIQIEKNGKEFYEALMKQSGNDKAKELYRYLAAEENKHIAAFEKMLSEIEKHEPSESYPGEYFAYISALAEDCVFTKKDKGAQIAKSVKSDKEAVDLGIGFEKDSIVFYDGIKKVVQQAEHKIIDALRT